MDGDFLTVKRFEKLSFEEQRTYIANKFAEHDTDTEVKRMKNISLGKYSNSSFL